MKKFIDASIFMGLNSKNEKKRIDCKNLFVENFDKIIYMSLENVGLCDDVVWKFDSPLQSPYRFL